MARLVKDERAENIISSLGLSDTNENVDIADINL